MMPGIHHPDKVKAEVIAGARAGVPLRIVAAETKVPLRTAEEWVQRAKEAALAEGRDPMLIDGEYRVAFLAQQVNERQLEHLTTKEGDELLKWMVPTNILRGTAIDKIMKQPEKSSSPNITINVTIQPKPTIEADYTVIEDA